VPFVEYDEVEAVCSDCGRIFRSEDALAAHRIDSHSGRVDTAPKDPLACADCGRRFTSASALGVHRSTEHARP
jgi:DNA-directed RNA polymerase subunit RPC12/RpoP